MARWVPLAGEEGEKMKEYIAIDLGGTNVRIATINEQFEIKDLHKEATGQNAILSQLVRLKGLEPTRVAAREPKSRMSTNSITGAYGRRAFPAAVFSSYHTNVAK